MIKKLTIFQIVNVFQNFEKIYPPPHKKNNFLDDDMKCKTYLSFNRANVARRRKIVEVILLNSFD